MLKQFGCCRNEHELAIQMEIEKLEKRGYYCQREYELPIKKGKAGKRLRAVVDIRATKNSEELLIEVGTLSQQHGDRLKLLKHLCPNAKVIHITQWKNFLNSFDWEKANEEWYYERYLKSGIKLPKEFSERTW